METRFGRTVIRLLQGDITRQDTDAIVNAANSSLMGGGGVDGAIHRAGGPQILKECIEIVRRQGPLPTGQAVITTGGKLEARYVIHTVGPVWKGGHADEDRLLAMAHRSSLLLAREYALESVSFPAISTGAYGFPKERAANIALKTVRDVLHEFPLISEVRFVLFSPHGLEVFRSALQALLQK